MMVGYVVFYLYPHNKYTAIYGICKECGEGLGEPTKEQGPLRGQHYIRDKLASSRPRNGPKLLWMWLQTYLALEDSSAKTINQRKEPWPCMS